MRVRIVDIRGTWRDVADAARVTVGMEEGINQPPSEYRRKMILCEHSPIREITVTAEWEDMPYWTAMHLVRHHIGCQPYVMSQRDDRQLGNQTHEGRKNAPQDAPVKFRFTFNVQAIISISRKRLCYGASKETRQAWEMFLNRLYDYEPELVDSCVPDCVYRGWCYEFKSCGWHRKRGFRELADLYRMGINGYGED